MNENWQKRISESNRVRLEDVLVGLSMLALVGTIYYCSMKVKNHYSVSEHKGYVYQTNYHGVKH